MITALHLKKIKSHEQFLDLIQVPHINPLHVSFSIHFLLGKEWLRATLNIVDHSRVLITALVWNVQDVAVQTKKKKK